MNMGMGGLHWLAAGGIGAIDVVGWSWKLLVFLTMVSVLVAAHELGHYLFARLFRMGVEEFAVGFGRPRWVYRRKTYTVPETGREETTEYSLRAWPLGGFVRIKGMQPEDDGSETAIPGGFYSRPPWQRLVVLAAGPVFSVLAGVAILIPLYAANGIYREVNEPVLDGVASGRAADKAGLKPGDVILEVGDRHTRTFYDLVRSARESGGKPQPVVFKRGDTIMRTTITAVLDPRPSPVIGPDLQLTPDFESQYKYGIGIPRKKVMPGLAGATTAAFTEPIRAIEGLLAVFARPQRFENSVSGPVTMVAVTAAVADEGIAALLGLAAIISISLGIFNLVPVPPLDGGQMIVAIVEMMRRGRRLSMRTQAAIGSVGVALILLLFVSVLFFDIRRFSGGNPFEGSGTPPAKSTPKTPR